LAAGEDFVPPLFASAGLRSISGRESTIEDLGGDEWGSVFGLAIFL
jgi:hypothetical protein